MFNHFSFRDNVREISDFFDRRLPQSFNNIMQTAFSDPFFEDVHQRPRNETFPNFFSPPPHPPPPPPPNLFSDFLPSFFGQRHFSPNVSEDFQNNFRFGPDSNFFGFSSSENTNNQRRRSNRRQHQHQRHQHQSQQQAQHRQPQTHHQSEPQFIMKKITPPQYIERLECPICLNSFEYNIEYPSLTCGHMFHQECIQPWLETNHTCPVCRANV